MDRKNAQRLELSKNNKKAPIPKYRSICPILCANTNSDTNSPIYRDEYTKSDTKFMTYKTRNKKPQFQLRNPGLININNLYFYYNIQLNNLKKY